MAQSVEHIVHIDSAFIISIAGISGAADHFITG
jgi:hypothetical protein